MKWIRNKIVNQVAAVVAVVASQVADGGLPQAPEEWASLAMVALAAATGWAVATGRER